MRRALLPRVSNAGTAYAGLIAGACAAALQFALLLPGAPSLLAQGDAFDRTKAPVVPQGKPPVFPAPKTAALKNGVSVFVIEDHHLPVVNVQALMYIPAFNEPEEKIGLTNVVREMLQEGTTTRSPEQLIQAAAEIGTTVSPFGFSSTTANVDKALDLMADQLLKPAFPAAALERLKANTIAQLYEGQQDPVYMLNRLFANIIYGHNHSYTREQAVHAEELSSITRDDVVDYYNQYFRPPNVVFVVSGDITAEQAEQKLDRVFGAWAAGKSARAIIPLPSGNPGASVYLFDRPGAVQSVIAFGDAGPKRDANSYPALLVNLVLGGSRSSRLVRNLRDQHRYTDSIESHYIFRAFPQGGTFMITTQAPTARTDSALNEILNEIRAIRTDRPLTSEELAFAKSAMIQRAALDFETLQQRADAVATLLREDLPLNYYQVALQRFNEVTPEKADSAAKKYLDPFAVGMIVVGDRKVLEPQLRAADIAPLIILEHTGGIGGN